MVFRVAGALGGGGGGSSLSDTVFQDSTGQIFVYRDTGSGTPSAFAIPSWASYTPVGAITAPTSLSNYALETGGNLAALVAQGANTTGTGSVTSASPAVFSCPDKGTVAFTVSGTWTGTIIVEASTDNTNWYTTSYVSLATGNTSTTFSANTAGQIDVVGFNYIRLRSNTIASGTANVVWSGSQQVSSVMLDNPLPAGSNTIGKVQVITSGGAIIDGATSALQTTGNTSLGSIDTKLSGNLTVTGPLTDTQLRASRVPVNSSVPQVTTGTILALTTAATGTNYTAFASQACTALDIVNNTGVTIEYRRNAAGVAMQIPTGAARMVIAITNANQVDVRRTDTSNTTVTMQAEAFVL